jgi:hypothetical protein
MLLALRLALSIVANLKMNAGYVLANLVMEEQSYANRP